MLNKFVAPFAWCGSPGKAFEVEIALIRTVDKMEGAIQTASIRAL